MSIILSKSIYNIIVYMYLIESGSFLSFQFVESARTDRRTLKADNDAIFNMPTITIPVMFE